MVSKINLSEICTGEEGTNEDVENEIHFELNTETRNIDSAIDLSKDFSDDFLIKLPGTPNGEEEINIEASNDEKSFNEEELIENEEKNNTSILNIKDPIISSQDQIIEQNFSFFKSSKFPDSVKKRKKTSNSKRKKKRSKTSYESYDSPEQPAIHKFFDENGQERSQFQFFKKYGIDNKINEENAIGTRKRKNTKRLNIKTF